MRRRALRTASPDGSVLLGRVTGEDRLWRGMKDRYALVTVERGSWDILYRGQTHRQAPGMVAVMQPGELYRYLRRDGPATYDVVLLEPAVVQAAREAVAPGPHALVIDPPQLSAGDPRARPLRELRAALLAGDDVACAVTEAALALVALGAAIRPPGRERRAVRRARSYLLERIAEPVRLDDLADHVGLDKYHLIRAFRAEVGAPPYEFLTHARVHRARELLRGGVPVGAVAPLVGYCDQSQLHRHFVRLTGVTPGRYARVRARSLRASTTAA